MHLTIVIGELQITYKLNDTPVSRKFVEVADKMKGQPVPDWTTWWRPDMNKLDLDEEWEKLKAYCSKCRLPINDRYDAKNLNDIHRDFHANVEPSNSVMVDLAAVNTQIHLIESIAKTQQHKNKNRWTPKFGCYQYNPNMHFTIPLEDSDYQYFKESNYNKLMMGYNTVGKNIGHCAYDNDVDTVKQGMVRPQLHASCEIIANLNKPSSVEEEYNPLKFWDSIPFTDNWIKKNNLGGYIDMTKPCNKVGSRMAEIGDLITPLTDGELDYIFKRQSIDRIIRH